DFAKGTSSRSTKLIHGGVRYLQQGNVSLVLEALRERGLLTKNAPHLVHHLGFIVPNYTWWEAPFYGVGLKIYDLLAGKLGLGPSKHLSREETLQRLPTLEPEGLKGGTIYFDGQFDDARLAICLAQTAADQGAILVNYLAVTRLLKQGDLVRGVVALDLESRSEMQINARVVINATGVFVDTLRNWDEPSTPPIIALSQGIHLVLDKSFLPGEDAIMVPKTDDGRVLFAIPWHDRALIGTTDTAVSTAQMEPRALPEEIDFLLTHAARYLTKDPQASDALSIFAGLRPLVKSADHKETALVPRDHSILISRSGLVTVTGGKWTTYRLMAQDAVNQAATIAELPDAPCRTQDLLLYGAPGYREETGTFRRQPGIEALLSSSALWGKPLHPRLPYLIAHVIWAARHEMARTVEDVLSRRTRALLLDAKLSVEICPVVAALLAAELGRDEAWQRQQIEDYTRLAAGYMCQHAVQ
ncbi:MAG TPA: glycerol-3-phosphate dehydrogenase/oxidase, partial [Verrucomicrobiae bacterium]|nr:glycerol-3-phosphate dehydrogenase/oxidase [Verrucomicrobiae bacterium]